MLVLSRRQGESIQLGNNIVIRVAKISRNRVTIAIDAPSDTRVLRGELAFETCGIDVDDTRALAELADA